MFNILLAIPWAAIAVLLLFPRKRKNWQEWLLYPLAGGLCDFFFTDGVVWEMVVVDGVSLGLLAYKLVRDRQPREELAPSRAGV